MNSLSGGDESDLDLQARYAEHVKSATVPGGETVALHAFAQFPTELVDVNEPQKMLEWATGFAKQTFGDESVFAARVDRDEKGQTGVDLFLTPIYNKRTKRTKPGDPGKRSVSISKHLKNLAERMGVVDAYNRAALLHNASTWGGGFQTLGENIGEVTDLKKDRQAIGRYNRVVTEWYKDNPTWFEGNAGKKGPRQIIMEANLALQGIALQTAFHEYLRDVAGLEGVKRGHPKKSGLDDWLSPEQLDLQRREEALTSGRIMTDAIRDGVIATIWNIPPAQPSYLVLNEDAWELRKGGIKDWNAAIAAIEPQARVDQQTAENMLEAQAAQNLARTAMEAAERTQAEADRQLKRAQEKLTAAEAAERTSRQAKIDAETSRQKAAAERTAAHEAAKQAREEQALSRQQRDAAVKSAEQAVEREKVAKQAEQAAVAAKKAAALDVQAASAAKATAEAAKREAEDMQNKAAAEALQAAKLKQDAERDRAEASAMRNEAVGVTAALEQWQAGALKPVGTERDWDWDWPDKVAEKQWTTVVKAGGIKAWQAVVAAASRVANAIEKAITRALTPERLEAEARKQVSNIDLLKIVMAGSEELAKKELARIMARAPVQKPASPELPQSVSEVIKRRENGLE